MPYSSPSLLTYTTMGRPFFVWVGGFASKLFAGRCFLKEIARNIIGVIVRPENRSFQGTLCCVLCVCAHRAGCLVRTLRMCSTCFSSPAFDSTIPASVLFFHPKARELVCFFSSSCRRASQPPIVAIVVRSRAMYGGRFGGSVLFRRFVCGIYTSISMTSSALPPRLDAVACSLCYARPAVL